LNTNDSHILTPRQILIVILLTLASVFGIGSLAIFLPVKLAMLFMEMVIILPGIVYVLLKKMPFAVTFRLCSINIKILFFTILLSLIAFVIVDETDRLILMIFPMPPEIFDALQNSVQIGSVADGVIIVITVVFIAAFGEELLFRGLIQHTLEFYRDPATAIVMASVIFAFAHFMPWTALQVTFMGLVLGYVVWKSGSVWPAIIFHGVNNLLNILLVNVDQQLLLWYSSGDHVKWIWIAVALAAGYPVMKAFNRACNRF
jgi:membrane protease YdiL (CAAX protease family)